MTLCKLFRLIYSTTTVFNINEHVFKGSSSISMFSPGFLPQEKVSLRVVPNFGRLCQNGMRKDRDGTI